MDRGGHWWTCHPPLIPSASPPPSQADHRTCTNSNQAQHKHLSTPWLILPRGSINRPWATFQNILFPLLPVCSLGDKAVDPRAWRGVWRVVGVNKRCSC